MESPQAGGREDGVKNHCPSCGEKESEFSGTDAWRKHVNFCPVTPSMRMVQLEERVARLEAENKEFRAKVREAGERYRSLKDLCDENWR